MDCESACWLKSKFYKGEMMVSFVLSYEMHLISVELQQFSLNTDIFNSYLT